jgi:O-glycosyl hydrolase
LIEKIPVLALKNQSSAIKNAKSLSNYQQTHVSVSVVSLTTTVKLVATCSARTYVNVSNHVRSGASKATSLTKNTANVSRSLKLVMSNVSRGSERT